MASTYLTRTPSSAGNRKTFTFSAWFKRSDLDGRNFVFSGGQNDQYQNDFGIEFGGDKIKVYDYNITHLVTTASFRDPSAWYHMVVAVDTTQSTASNRIKLYVNGSQITAFDTANYPGQNENTGINSAYAQYVGSSHGNLTYDGYMAHVHLTDGTAYAASTFGSTSTNGQWVPNLNPSVTYGTNGYFLKFTNASDLGEDFSGNNNDYTKSGSGDKVLDNPENNFATLNVLQARATYGMPTLSEGNLQFGSAGFSTSWGYRGSTIEVPSGKWYCEVKCSGNSNAVIGVFNTGYYGEGHFLDQNPQNNTGSWGIYADGATVTKQILNGSSSSATIDEFNDGDIVGMELDADNKTIKFYVNGSLQTGLGTSGTIDISAGTDDAFIFVALTPNGDATTFQFNFGNPAYTITSGNTDENGYGNFEYAPSSGYLALCTQNLATELTLPIGKGDSYFNTTLVTSTGSNITINTGFKPDFLWTKSRSYDARHELHNTTSGDNKRLVSNLTTAEETFSNYMEFTSNGATFKTNIPHALAGGGAGRTGVAWSWRANGGTTSSNTDGSITSTVQANQTAGFSIVTYTGTGANATVGHGLGKAPNLVIVKLRSGIGSWAVYSRAVGATKVAYLESTSAFFVNSSFWNNTDPTSSVFSIGSEATTNTNGGTLVAYCFADIEGYSKTGTYIGNASTNGPFIYTGFKPSWVMIKRIDGANGWNIFDSARNPTNVVEKQLFANSNAIEEADVSHNAARDYLSNGFKIRETGNDVNVNGSSYLYMAFAENPFVDSSGVPANAR